jgi:hypothetical protein
MSGKTTGTHMPPTWAPVDHVAPYTRGRVSPKYAEGRAWQRPQEVAGLLTIGTDGQGAVTWKLAPEVMQVAHQMAMSVYDGALELIAGMLDSS